MQTRIISFPASLFWIIIAFLLGATDKYKHCLMFIVQHTNIFADFFWEGRGVQFNHMQAESEGITKMLVL